MTKKTFLTVVLLFLVTTVCHAHALTPEQANTIIVILSIIVIVLLILGSYSLHFSRVVYRRNEQLNRILNALNDYRAIVGEEHLSISTPCVQSMPQRCSWSHRNARWTTLPRSAASRTHQHSIPRSSLPSVSCQQTI